MKYIRKHIKLITILTIILIISTLIILKIYLEKNSKNNVNEEIKNEIIINEKEEVEEQKEEPIEIIESVYVDIKGAVITPGVYEIENNKKVIDQTTPNMIQKLKTLFVINPLISMGI